MKKILLAISLLTTSIMSVMAQSGTINVKTAGTLSTLLSNPMSIEELTITGNLNGTDFRLLREMAGNDYLGQPTNGVLKKLDISGANIVEGGEKYLDTDRVTSSTGTYTRLGGDFFHFGTQNNVIGNSLFAGCDKLEEIILPNSITSIGDYVFWYCLNLKALEIPKNVSSIGSEFIFGPNKISKLSVAEGNQNISSPEGSNVLMQGTKLIYGISNAKIPAGTTIIGASAFASCSGLGDVKLPEGVTTIENSAFRHCGLTSLELPASVTSIGNWALIGLSNATSIKVAEGNLKYDSRDNCNAIIETATNKLLFGYRISTIPTTVTEIGENSFYNLSNYTLTIPSTITKIGDRAFYYSYNLTLQVEHAIPLVINENVFSYLQNSTLRVPSGSKAAYASATGWKNFGTILEGNEGATFTAKTTEGWDMVFTILDETAKTCQVGYLDGSWDKISVDRNAVEGSVTIPQTANGYDVVKIGKYALRNVYKMTSVTIPNTVTAIEEYAFEGCNALTSFELPASVISLGNRALSGFSNATSIKVAKNNSKYESPDNCNAIIEKATNKLLFGYKITTIPATVTEIGERAFNNLSNYTLTIPSTVTKIDDYAFSGNNLTLKVERTTPLVINENVFINLSNSTLRVPAGYKTAYASATGWKNFGTILEGNEGATFTAKTTEGWDMVFTILDDNAKTCQVGYIDGTSNKTAVDRNAVNSAVTIPKTAKDYTIVKIGKYALYHVQQMTSVTLPNTVTSIDDHAFDNCYALTSFELPASVTFLGDRALSTFDNATSIKVAESNTKYDSRDDCNAIIEKATNKLLFGYMTTTIPSTVAEIGEYAFEYLNNCTLTIPSTITKIGNYAFKYCSNLTLEVEHTTPLEISENVFQGLSNSTLRVPAGCKAAYASATGWNKFANIVEKNKVSKNVATAGTLSQLISDSEKFTITELILTGNLNGTDFRLLREMAGSDYLGHATNGQLMKLDISGARIVAGGDKYFDSDGLYNENGNRQYGFGKHSVTTKDNVIGDCLFVGCSKLADIKIPSNIIEIGEYAFMRTNISSLDIPETVGKVDLSFFYDTKMSNLQIPQNVNSLTASGSFMGNSTLSSITVDANNSKYDSRNNCNAIIDKESNTLILGCKNTIIPDGITSIGEYAFSHCSGLTSISIPTSVTSLRDGAFFAAGLTSISLPSTLKRIEFNAFAYAKISSITIPASVEYIGYSVLRACSNLTKIIVEAGNNTYDSRGNCNAIIETATNTLIQGCNTATIPASVAAIGSQAFQECYNLASITIPASVSSIANSAFHHCNNLKSVLIEAETPPAITEYAFSNRANADLIVPVGSISAYKAADYWKEFKTIKDTAGNTEDAPNSVAIHVGTAGTLSTLLTKPMTITDLTITGNLNGTDFRLLREMAGSDYQGHPTNGHLKKLDISGARIVSGGDKYFEGNGIYRANGSKAFGNGNKSLSTKDNVVGDYMFAGCTQLVEVKIPTNTCEIGDWSFLITNISSLDIPETVNKICLSFAYGTQLSSLVISKYVTTIYPSFCQGNENFTSIIVEEGNPNYNSRDNCNAVIETSTNTLMLACKNTIIPSGTKRIGTFAFYSCKGLTDLNIPEGVTSIEDDAFYRCTSLQRVNIPNSVTNIGYEAFSWCPLREVTLPSNLKTIGSFAFSLTNISSITIPASVEEIGERFLNHCSNLTQIIVESGNKKFDSRDNCNGIIERATNTLIQGCKATMIPTSVTAIGRTAFTECFKLESITIPNSITSIGNAAFMYCGDLKDIYCHIENPFAVSKYAFPDYNNKATTLHVPVGTKALYLAAEGWKDAFSEENIIEDIVKEELVLNKTKLSIAKGQTEVLTATCPSSWSNKKVTWKSSNTKVATVSSTGEVTGVKTGTATITCTSKATGQKATCEVTVGQVKLSKTEIGIQKGEKMTLKATVYPTTLEDQSVTWESSNTKVATVSETGEVTGVKTGTATITCTSNATGLSATCKVTVGQIKLSKSEVSLQKGKAVTLKATVYPTTLDQSVTWKSSDSKIATVSSTGKVTGVKTGTATITCTSAATGLSATCEVTVGQVKLSKTEVAIQKGKTVTLKATVYPTTEEDQSVTWKSSDEKIATVSSTGKVTGVKTGIATITCTSNATGLSATCEVTVGQVKLSKTEVTIQKGKAVTLKATVYPTTLEDQSVTWESSNTKIATVSSSGKVKGVRTGTVKITCISNATGLSATCTVTVTATANSRSLGGGDDEVTGIDDMDVDSAVVEPFDVYDISGRKVRHQVTSLDDLPNGIYIVNGRKVLKK